MPARRILGLLAVLLALAAPALAAAPDHHALVQIDTSTPGAADWVRAQRGRLDIVRAKPGSFVEIAATPDVLDLLRSAGLTLKILEPDMEAAGANPDKGPGFGIFHTYSESEAWMDSLRLLYPQVVSEKWSLGQSGEGRDIWCFRVSDNPDVDEDEPETLIDGMHHAREIMASEFPVMFAEYLAQNYGVDPEITWLVDNRELYVVPIMNPDGFVYNESTNPTGGGMWRKNRRNNGDGSVGVDINRNYPYQWGYNDSGSSPYGSSETYRGTAPASEPEVQALMAFVNSRQIRTHDSVHTYSNLLLYPWGYTTATSPDDALFSQMAAIMTSGNGYTYGPPPVVLYDVNGDTVDWMYSDTSGHTRVLSFSSEIGSTGFWPAESERQALFAENIWPHLYLMRAAGEYTAAHSAVATDDLGGLLEPGESGLLTFTVENQSAFETNAAGVTVFLSSDDPWVGFGAASRGTAILAPFESDDLTDTPIPITVEAGCPQGHVVEFTATVAMSTGDLVFPLSFVVGTPVTLLLDDFETGTGKWFGTGAWGWTAATSHSPTHAVTDSPGGNYGNNSATTLTSVYTYEATRISFWHTYAIENGWDYGRVQVRPAGGTWTTLGSFTGSKGWGSAEYDLSAFAGQALAFRFLLETDGSVVEDGWTIDDVELFGQGGTNQPPAIPVPVTPGAGAVTGPSPVLTVANAVDPDGDAVVYGFRIYADADCTVLVAAADDVPEGDATTSWTAPSLAAAAYWWRAWAGDGGLRSNLCAAGTFTVDDLSAVGLPLSGGSRLAVLEGVSGRGARLSLTLDAAADVSVAIHDLRGALVRRIHTGRLEGGERTLVWDGRDRGGRQAASGVYLVRVQAGAEVLTGRVVMVR